MNSIVFGCSKLLLKSSLNLSSSCLRYTSSSTVINMAKALVLGVYQDSGDSPAPILTPAATEFDAKVGGKIVQLVKKQGLKKGKCRIFYDLDDQFTVVGVVGLGPKDASYNELEDIDERRENVRLASATGAKTIRESTVVDNIYFDPMGDSEAAAEGASIGLFYFDELKSKKYKKKPVEIHLAGASDEGWQKGMVLAEAQNVCRRLAEMPANLMTPTIFCQNANELFASFDKVKVIVHDKEWAKSKKMESFLSVAKGSAEPPKFLELHYNNKPDVKPFVMVGKGICFDSGGISLKPSANMDKMRYDMSGAANVVSTIFALAKLNAPVNVVGLTPLCENLPGPTANKPGDVVVAMNGKSIQIDNTDAEGRLILADGLAYAHEFQPQAILDIATLTGAMGISLGSAATGVFTTSAGLYDLLRKAGSHTGDRVWRMPLWNHYNKQVTDSQLADLLNISKNGNQGGSCTAAAFLKEFVECPNWMHLDIAGVMASQDDNAYLGKGMSGRPVRTLYYFLNKFFAN